MSDVITFLEKMGSDARWLSASDEEIETALNATPIEKPVRAAIASRDADTLQRLLNLPVLLGMQVPGPAEEEEEEGDEEPGEHPEPEDMLATRPIHT